MSLCTLQATRGSPAPPFAPRDLSVPTKERLWRDEEGAPAPSRQQPREGGEDRPIHRAIGDARIELALEDAHLVAEHHDLDVLVRLGPPRGSEQAEDPAQAEVTEGECHGRSWSLAANTASEHCQLRAAIEVLVPYTSASTVAVSSLGNSVRVMAFRSVMVLVFPSQRGSRYWLADKTASYLQPAPEPGAHPSGIPDCGGAVTNHRHVRCVAASRLRPGAVPTGDPAQARRSQTLADRRGDRRVR